MEEATGKEESEEPFNQWSPPADAPMWFMPAYTDSQVCLPFWNEEDKSEHTSAILEFHTKPCQDFMQGYCSKHGSGSRGRPVGVSVTISSLRAAGALSTQSLVSSLIGMRHATLITASLAIAPAVARAPSRMAVTRSLTTQRNTRLDFATGRIAEGKMYVALHMVNLSLGVKRRSCTRITPWPLRGEPLLVWRSLMRTVSRMVHFLLLAVLTKACNRSIVFAHRIHR